MPFDFFGLGQQVPQQNQNEPQQDGPLHQNENQNLGQQEMGQNLQQQLNQWDPWPAWPEQIMVQQHPQQGFNLNVPAQGHLVVDMDMDLNLDPLEVIINPVDPPNNNGVMDLNELIQEIEQHIPQQQQHMQGIQALQVQNAMEPIQVQGFPIPPLPDVLGEEIPFEQLFGIEEEMNNQLGHQGHQEDLQLHHLNQLGGQGNAQPMPDIPNIGVMLELPIQNENPMMEMAYDQQADQQGGQNAENAENLQNIALEAAPLINNHINLEHENAAHDHGQHMQVGFVLTQNEVNGPSHQHWENLWDKAKQAEPTKPWTPWPISAPGNVPAQVPLSWAKFFTAMLLSPTNFLWAKELIHSNILNYFDDPYGFVATTVPSKCPANTSSCVLSEISDHPEDSNLRMGEKEGQEKFKAIPGKSTPKKRGLKVLSDTEVRRSDRFKGKNNGFKSSICSDRRCFSCSPSPPTMSTKLIKKLGVELCKMDQGSLSEEALLKKKKRATAVGKGKQLSEQEREYAEKGSPREVIRTSMSPKKKGEMSPRKKGEMED